MLDFLRRGVKSWVAKILLALLIVSFAVWGIGDIFTGNRTPPIAHVGETEVPFERMYAEIRRQQNALTQQRGALVSLSEMRAAEIDQRTVEGLVRDATYGEELNTLGIAIPDEAIRQNIVANQQFQDSTGNFSRLIYEGVISQRGFSPGEYQALTANLLGQQIMVDAVARNVLSAPGTAEAITAYQGETRTIATVALQAMNAPDPGEPDEATLQTWFEANSDRFIAPERRWGSYLHTNLAAMAESMTPTEEEVRADYDANPDTYTVAPARTVEQIVFDDQETAQAAADRIAAGEATYEEIAAEQNLTLDDLPLGTVNRGDLPEFSEAAVFGATEPGVLAPVEGTFGWLLLNVTDVEIGGLAPFEEVRDRITATTAYFRAQEAALTAANSIDDLRASGADMAELGKETGLELKRFQGLENSGRVTEGTRPTLASYQEFVAEVFDAASAEERDILELSDGSYVLVMVERVAESHLPELETIRDNVIAAWQLEQRLVAQEANAASLLTGGSDLISLAETLQTEAVEHEPFTRDSLPGILSPDLAQLIFDGDEGDLVIGRGRDGLTVLIAKINAVTPLAQEEMATQTDAIADILGDSLARDQLEYFARALERRHTPLVNQTAVDQVFEALGGNTSGGGY